MIFQLFTLACFFVNTYAQALRLSISMSNNTGIRVSPRFYKKISIWNVWAGAVTCTNTFCLYRRSFGSLPDFYILLYTLYFNYFEVLRYRSYFDLLRHRSPTLRYRSSTLRYRSYQKTSISKFLWYRSCMLRYRVSKSKGFDIEVYVLRYRYLNTSISKHLDWISYPTSKHFDIEA